MCLSLALNRPDDVLAKGKHNGFQWIVIHNGCGYVRVPKGHPWHGKGYEDIHCEVHGGLTFSEPDETCDAPGDDDAHWFGFDCAHCFDKPDPELLQPKILNYMGHLCRLVSDAFDFDGGTQHSVVRSQKYVESECRSLCEQAWVSHLDTTEL